MKRIAIIGPTGVGKTTTSGLVAKRLGVPLVSLDETRHLYLSETGYDADYASELKRRDCEGVIRYWEEFNPHVVRRTLESNPTGVFDFGAIHSVYDHLEKQEQVAAWMSDLDDVVLLLPCDDQKKSLEILIERGRDPGMSEPAVAMWRRIIGRFISHVSNWRLSRRVVYTEGRTPAEVAEQIMKR